MKSSFALALIAASLSFTINPHLMNEKVIKIFSDTYPDAKNIQWTEHDSYYEVHFENNMIKCKIDYDQEGKLIMGFRYYFSKDLPPYILARIKGKYSDKKIYGVTEVSNENGVKYNIVLESDKHWYLIESNSQGDIHLTDKFNKS